MQSKPSVMAAATILPEVQTQPYLCWITSPGGFCFWNILFSAVLPTFTELQVRARHTPLFSCCRSYTVWSWEPISWVLGWGHMRGVGQKSWKMCAVSLRLNVPPTRGSGLWGLRKPEESWRWPEGTLGASWTDAWTEADVVHRGLLPLWDFVDPTPCLTECTYCSSGAEGQATLIGVLEVPLCPPARFLYIKLPGSAQTLREVFR